MKTHTTSQSDFQINPQSQSQARVIRLTKIKQWYLPVDADSYNLLKSAGVPLVRIHQNFLPTVQLATKPRGLRGKEVNFQDEILNPFFDRVSDIWNSKEHRKSTITRSNLKFETTHGSVLESARITITKLETSLRRFFERWGYNAHFEYSEMRGKCKLSVSFKYDSSRLPVIPLVADPDVLPQVVLVLGNLKLTFIMDVDVGLGLKNKLTVEDYAALNEYEQERKEKAEAAGTIYERLPRYKPGSVANKGMEVNIAIATGSDWTSIHTSRCLYDQVSDVRGTVRTLMDISSKDPFNFERKYVKKETR